MDEYRDIREVRRVDSDESANELLGGGWNLLGVATGQNEDKFPTIQYILGKPHVEENHTTYI